MSSNYVKLEKISSIIDQICSEKDKNKKLEILYNNQNNEALKTILYLMFNKKVEWNIPNGGGEHHPDFKYFPSGGLEFHMHSVHNKLRIFIKGNDGDNIRQTKREALWLNFLMDLDPQDADMMMKIKDGIKFDGIDAKLVAKVFPDLVNA